MKDIETDTVFLVRLFCRQTFLERKRRERKLRMMNKREKDKV